jgi:hypothetical protein
MAQNVDGVRHKTMERMAQRRLPATLWMLAFAALSGALIMSLITLLSKQPFMGNRGFGAYGLAFLTGGLCGGFLAVLFHVPPFRQLMWLGSKIGEAADEAIDRSGGFGCIGLAMLPFVASYYILSWPGIKLAEKLGYIRMIRDRE